MRYNTIWHSRHINSNNRSCSVRGNTGSCRSAAASPCITQPIKHALLIVLIALFCFMAFPTHAITPLQKENVDELQREQVVLWAYHHVLQRSPDPEGLRHHMESIKDGNLDKDHLIQTLKNSPEYKILKQTAQEQRRQYRFSLILTIVFSAFFIWFQKRNCFARYKTILPFLILAVAFVIYNIRMGARDDDIYYLRLLSDYRLADWVVMRYNQWSSRLLIESILVTILHWGGFCAFRVLNVLVSLVLAYALSSLSDIKRTKYGTWLVLIFIAFYPIMQMGTAGWAATTTSYFWALSFGLAALIPAKKILSNESIGKGQGILFALATVYATNQEQMALVLSVVYAGLAGWLIIQKRIHFFALFQAAVSLSGLLFHLTVPGNQLRYNSELQVWFPDYNMLFFFDKVEISLSSTLAKLFFGPNILVLAFLTTLFLLVLFTTRNRKDRIIAAYPLGLSLIAGFGVLEKFFPIINGLLHTGDITNATSRYGTIHVDNAGLLSAYIPLLLMGLAVIAVLISLLNVYRENPKEWIFAWFVLGMGFATRIAMGFSPTIWASGTRTYVYLYFAIILISLRLLCQLEVKNEKAFSAFCGVLSWMAFLAYLSNLFLIR